MISSRVQVYNLAVGLHRIGIAHGDLEPQNVARVRGGGLRLIDFSDSGNHLCNEIKVRYMDISLLVAVSRIGWSTTGGPFSKPEAKVFRTADIATVVVEKSTPPL
jgi:serine/threonine protein kinase